MVDKFVIVDDLLIIIILIVVVWTGKFVPFPLCSDGVFFLLFKKITYYTQNTRSLSPRTYLYIYLPE